MNKIIVLIILYMSIPSFAVSGVTLGLLEGAWWGNFGAPSAEFAIQSDQVWLDYDSRYHPCKIDGDSLVFELGEGVGEVRNKIVSLDGNTLTLEHIRSGETRVLKRIARYQLDPTKVVSTRLHKWKEQISVSIHLDEAESASFAELTRGNVGNMLQVVLDGQVLIEAIVKAEIDGGSMNVRVSDEAEAELIMEKLNSGQL